MDPSEVIRGVFHSIPVKSPVGAEFHPYTYTDEMFHYFSIYAHLLGAKVLLIDNQRPDYKYNFLTSREHFAFIVEREWEDLEKSKSTKHFCGFGKCFRTTTTLDVISNTRRCSDENHSLIADSDEARKLATVFCLWMECVLSDYLPTESTAVNLIEGLLQNDRDRLLAQFNSRIQVELKKDDEPGSLELVIRTRDPLGFKVIPYMERISRICATVGCWKTLGLGEICCYCRQ